MNKEGSQTHTNSALRGSTNESCACHQLCASFCMGGGREEGWHRHSQTKVLNVYPLSRIVICQPPAVQINGCAQFD